MGRRAFVEQTALAWLSEKLKLLFGSIEIAAKDWGAS
jgi:hypothetical protein